MSRKKLLAALSKNPKSTVQAKLTEGWVDITPVEVYSYLLQPKVKLRIKPRVTTRKHVERDERPKPFMLGQFMPEIPACTNIYEFEYWQGGNKNLTVRHFCRDCDPEWQQQKQAEGKCSLAIAKRKLKCSGMSL